MVEQFKELIKQKFLKALEELRKQKKRNFEQSVDLIINLQKINIRKTPINLFVSVPHKIKEKEICGFLTRNTDIIDCVTKEKIEKYKGQNKETKKLTKKYEFFISHASLMPSIATIFGRILGPAGKMPSPQLGILVNDDDKSIQKTKDKIQKIIRIRAKEPSIKILIGKENMENSKIFENAMAVINSLLNVLPREKENIKSILIKFTMSKPQKIKLK